MTQSLVTRRVQLSRRARWRKPAGVVVVARPTRWGNPFRVTNDATRAAVVAAFEDALAVGDPILGFTTEDAQRELAGRDLACWCPLDQPCHADVLLRVANLTAPPTDQHTTAHPTSPALPDAPEPANAATFPDSRNG